MSRTVNKEKTEEQRGHILNIAIKLFNKKGYEKTSLEEIISASGISKGTFYHYFSSKEALLDYFSDRMNNQLLPEIRKVLDDKKLDALKKFNKIIRKIKVYKVFHRHEIKTIFLIMFKEENGKLRQKLTTRITRDYVPIFTDIIRQGKKEGIFEVGNPEDTAELLLNLSISAGDTFAPIVRAGKLNLTTIRFFMSKAKVYKDAYTRILGMKKGNLDMYDKATLVKIMKK